MSDIHIDDFYRDSAKILVRLYATFPTPITLYVEDISGPDEPDEFGLHHPRFESCFSTMVWLAQHDYLHFDELLRKEALDHAVLTRKAFLILAGSSVANELHDTVPAETPQSIADRLNTQIAQLRNALNEGSSFQLKAAVTNVLSHPGVGDSPAL
ncbi:MAG: hypothetical protein P8M21_04975 [Halioglobus sp.]|nr:hypothetical protein [Halioglobus sp.]